MSHCVEFDDFQDRSLKPNPSIPSLERQRTTRLARIWALALAIILYGRTFMKDASVARNPQRSVRTGIHKHVKCLCWVVLFTIIGVLSASGQARLEAKPDGADPVPEPAVSAILAAFDKYEVVGMPVDHGAKDLDDMILTLIRNPSFWRKVNDIEIECGNSLYQDVLDRYTSGEDVPFREVQKVWQNTSQPPCGLSAFYQEVMPLVRAINQKLPRGRQLRVLGGDPPLNWDQIKTAEDLHQAILSLHRDSNIASVMEKEVLARHRKALMLMGTFHIMHGGGATAVFEGRYPNSTFIISDLGMFDTNLADFSSSAFATWPIPALASIRGTWLGKSELSKFLPPPDLVDQDCNYHRDFPANLRKPVEQLFDAVLYLGPQDLRLWEKAPADILLDTAYMNERRRREMLPGSPIPSVPVSNGPERDIVARAADPFFRIDTPPPASQAAIEGAVRDCQDRKRQAPPK